MAELEELKKNPLAALEIAVGDPFAQLKAQDPKDGYSMDQLYRSEDTRFILKKARFSRDDIRVFDVDGELALVSHHPGKNPMDTIDPFGVTNTDVIFSPLGEWEALTDVSSYRDDLSSLKIRPKTLTIHGRQFLRRNGETFLNIAKLGKLKTLSLRDTFGIFKGDSNEILYKVTADLFSRILTFRNTDGEQIAVMAKTKKALIKEAVLGSGLESTIDIARGVDISVILASIFGIMAVGNSLIKDAGKNFLFDPVQDKFTDEVFNVAMGDEEESELLGFLGDEGYLEGGDLDFEGLAEGAQEGLAGGLEGLGFEEAAAGLEEFDISEAVEGLGEGFDEGFEEIGEGIGELCNCCLECLGGME